MKKAALCIFSLFFLLLVFCTAVSFLVEDWMTPDVVAVKGMEAEDPFTKERVPVCPVEAVRTDENGDFVLEIVEEDGWQTSTRAVRRNLDHCRPLSEDNVTSPSLSAYAQYIRFSSKPVSDGARVRVSGASESALGLVVMRLRDPGAAAVKETLARLGFRVRESAGDAVLAETESLSAPFFADEVRALCAEQGFEVVEAFSMRDFGELADALPLLAAAGVLFGAAILFWALFCRAVRSGSTARYALWIGIAAALFGSVAVLSLTALPSSVLPQRHILDLSHYGAAWSSVCAALQSVGAASLADPLRQKAAAAFWLILTGYALMLLFFLAVCVFSGRRKHRRRKGKHFATK